MSEFSKETSLLSFEMVDEKLHLEMITSKMNAEKLTYKQFKEYINMKMKHFEEWEYCTYDEICEIQEFEKLILDPLTSFKYIDKGKDSGITFKFKKHHILFIINS